jgi:MFS transporter, DHA1 family, multidrug resistance protein
VLLARTHGGVAVMLGCLFALQPMATDLYLASLPTLRIEFDASVAAVQLTLAVFTLAFGLSQLVYGPLSDRFGRRPILMFGVTVYALASLACAFAPTLEWLIAARFCQALGACSGQVVGRAVIRDNHEGPAAARLFGLIQTGVVMVPILGPTLGGAISAASGWRSVFLAISAASVVLTLAVIRWLPETNRRLDPSATAPRMLMANSKLILGHRKFAGYTMVVAFAYLGLAVWLSLSPFILIDLLGLSPQMFGVVFGAPVIGYIATNFLVARLAHRYGIDRLLAIGTLLAAIAGTIQLALALLGVQTLAAVIGPMVLYMIAMGLTQPAAMAGAITPFARNAGTASALLGCLTMVAGAGAGFIAARLHDGTTLAVGIGFAIAGWGGLFAYHLVIRGAPPQGA